MAKNKTKTDGKVSDKKLNRLLIEKKLEVALSDLKSLISKKKFDLGVKKAGKLISKEFSKKSLDNFRKQHNELHPQEEVKDDTTLLIEELP